MTDSNRPPPPPIATGIGSWPGDDATDYAEAVRTVLGELPDGAYVPELPGRGAIAQLTGRGLAVIADLGVDLQPAGWRLTGGDRATSSVEHRRARSLLAQDLDMFEEQAQDYEGAVKVQIAGPWTLAATTEKPRGDKVLSDHGARRDLAQALAAGVVEAVADLRRRVPKAAELIVQVDEPALPAVLAGSVPTASGFGRHRTVHPPEASELLALVFGAIDDCGASPWVHSCARDVPVDLLVGAGAQSVLLDASLLDPGRAEQITEAAEAGARIGLGVVPTSGAMPTEKALTEQTLRLTDRIGLDPNTQPLLITPACGLAGVTPSDARELTALSAKIARHLRD